MIIALFLYASAYMCCHLFLLLLRLCFDLEILYLFRRCLIGPPNVKLWEHGKPKILVNGEGVFSHKLWKIPSVAGGKVNKHSRTWWMKSEVCKDLRLQIPLVICYFKFIHYTQKKNFQLGICSQLCMTLKLFLMFCRKSPSPSLYKEEKTHSLIRWD